MYCTETSSILQWTVFSKTGGLRYLQCIVSRRTYLTKDEKVLYILCCHCSPAYKQILSPIKIKNKVSNIFILQTYSIGRICNINLFAFATFSSFCGDFSLPRNCDFCHFDAKSVGIYLTFISKVPNHVQNIPNLRKSCPNPDTIISKQTHTPQNNIGLTKPQNC